MNHEMKRKSPYSPRSAFTLIELLTVIAIVGVLTAILLPSLEGTQRKAKEANKQNMYRQFFAANSRYVNDNGGRVCLAADNRSGVELNWRTLMAPYIAEEAMSAIDPVDAANRAEVFIDPLFDGYDETRPHLTGIGMNTQLRLPESASVNAYGLQGESAAQPMRMSAVTYPESRIFMGDVSSVWFFDSVTASSALDASRHEGETGMFLRFDGSIALLTAADAALGVTDPSRL